MSESSSTEKSGTFHLNLTALRSIFAKNKDQSQLANPTTSSSISATGDGDTSPKESHSRPTTPKQSEQIQNPKSPKSKSQPSTPKRPSPRSPVPSSSSSSSNIVVDPNIKDYRKQVRDTAREEAKLKGIESLVKIDVLMALESQQHLFMKSGQVDIQQKDRTFCSKYCELTLSMLFVSDKKDSKYVMKYPLYNVKLERLGKWMVNRSSKKDSKEVETGHVLGLYVPEHEHVDLSGDPTSDEPTVVMSLPTFEQFQEWMEVFHLISLTNFARLESTFKFKTKVIELEEKIHEEKKIAQSLLEKDEISKIYDDISLTS